MFRTTTVLFIAGLLLSLNARATNKLEDIKALSESSYISLLTCDPGPELYATFGHSAIGVVDPQQNIRMVFNYGTFSFNVPFFYAKFASGKLLYQLSTSSYSLFLREYEYRQRRVVEEKLNLSQPQRQRLFDVLKENYMPENREYQYDFFFDNCATRIIDIFYDALGDSLVYVPSTDVQPKTFRYLIDECLGNNYWSDFGIDLALGSVIDKNASAIQQTFLPDYLSAYINNCEINGQAFVVGKRALVKETANFPPTPWYLRPALMNWFLFALVAFFTIFLRSKSWVIGDRIVFGVFGLVGLVAS